MKKIGLFGFGHLGKFLYAAIKDDKRFEVVFIWNRSEIIDPSIDKNIILKNIGDFKKYEVDLIIEVAHPIITESYGEIFLEYADYMIGSPTALANEDLFKRLSNCANKNKRKIYIPCGAFWGASDIRKMADKKTLLGLHISMKKHPTSLKLEGVLKEKLDNSIKDVNEPIVLYEGPVRNLCKLAPNNVNTMAVGALSAHNLGFDLVQGSLVADPSLVDKHLVEIEVTGPFDEKANEYFKCATIRSNPAVIGHVTGNQTYVSFYNSLLETLDCNAIVGFRVC